MDFKEYLLTQNKFRLVDLAFKMWPNNKHADTYLSAKLGSKNEKVTFTAKDEKLARRALKELGIELIEDSKKYK